MEGSHGSRVVWGDRTEEGRRVISLDITDSLHSDDETMEPSEHPPLPDDHRKSRNLTVGGLGWKDYPGSDVERPVRSRRPDKTLTRTSGRFSDMDV